MRKKFFLSIALVLFCAFSARAHPLGNFSVNHFSQIEINESTVKVRAVLDKAEIPTFQESQQIDADKDGALSDAELNAHAEKLTPEYAANLLLTVDGQTVPLRPAAKKIALVEGSANLPIMRLEWDFVGDLPNLDSADAHHRVSFENKNNSERIGWNEIVVARAAGINVFDSSAFGSGASDELKKYPEDLSARLDERAAEFSFTTAPLPADAKTLRNRDGQTASAPVAKDGFAELIAVEEITPTIILLGLVVAFGFGAAHALSPGHGKTVVGAYLVGSRGTVKHAIFLGATVTITHTLSVFAIGIVALFASEYVLPESFFPYLSFASGLMVFVIGLTLFKNRLFSLLGYKSKNDDLHDDIIDDDEPADSEHANTGENFTHTHGGSTHSHAPPKQIGWRSLLALGVSGGLIPCPSALVLMLAAIGKNRVGYGLILTLVFSFGLAATLTAVGLVFLYAGKLFDNPSVSGNRLVKALPVFSAFVITCVGAVICYNSF